MTSLLRCRPTDRFSRGRRLLPVVLAAGLLLPACRDGAEPQVPKATVGPVPATAQRDGDPALGYAVIVGNEYMSCGLPYAAWRRVSPPAADAITLPGRDGANARLPYSLSVHRNDQGIEIISANCFACHAATFAGELVIGLGNESLDFTADPMPAIDAVGSYVGAGAETEAWRKWAERIGAIAPYMVTDTIGVNPAPNLTLALIAHRDPATLAWSPTPLLEPPPRSPLPVSVPPWWRMAKKHALFYNAMGRGDHARYMMMKSLVCADSVAEAEAIDAGFVHVRAYLASLRAPEYPFAIDAELAAAGRSVFEQHCASCHGIYGPDGEYPNLLVALDVVGTDPEYARQAYDDADRFMDWFNRSWYGKIASAVPAPGYVAPPLDGVWATAPFLHNGSVPTLAALLDSGTRPTYWERDREGPEFDEQAVGWSYREVEGGKQSATDTTRRKRIYDTTLPGYSNRGHQFGDELSARERRAVIEYLKTL